ncbi:hypothetical protein [Pseudonocardia nigra]|uniref:hypothetical protein n=1 Tax=Pseudonocardia nigra TaxID=1921578 RepID=UPI001C60482F|nr:hypothetical protein [Pseudonocardia nigra]
MIALRTLGVVLVIVLGGVGMLVLSSAVLFVLGVGAVVGLCAYWAAPALPDSLLARAPDTPAGIGAVAGAGTVGICFVLGGIGVLFGGAVVTLVVAGAAFLAWRGLRGTAELPEAEPPPHDPPAAPPAPAAPVLPAGTAVAEMSTLDLCRAWRVSYLRLQHAAGATELDGTAQIRQRYLDELERRDLAGFRRWIDSGARAASDPARFIRTDIGSPSREGGATG